MFTDESLEAGKLSTAILFSVYVPRDQCQDARVRAQGR